MQSVELLHHPSPRPHLLTVGVGSVLLGLALILAGRRLFWLFVAGLGFVLADETVSRYFTGLDPSAALIISVVAGLAGAVLAIFVQRFAIGLAGALAGAYYLRNLLAASSLHDPQILWIALLVGAVVGAILFLALFKWALIFFSSVVGAHLVVHTLQGFDISPGISGAVFLLLIVAGVIFQGGGARRVVQEND